LVKRLPPGWKRSPNSRIRQGYFSLRGQGIEIRVRAKGSEHFITIKAGRGTVRREEDVEISKKCFNVLWPLVCDASVAKRRYRIPCGRKTIDMDVYEEAHRGLITAEVEFESRRECSSFKPPIWFGREITGNRRYANEVLARRKHF